MLFKKSLFTALSLLVSSLACANLTEPQIQKRGDWKQNIYIENGTDRVLLQEVNTDDDGWPTDTLKSSQIWPGQQVVHSVAPYPSRGTVLTVTYSMFDDPEKNKVL